MMGREMHIPMEELIESGQVKGREVLAWLDEHGQYVYHGSWQKIDELEPRQSFSNGNPDGEPAVCAADDYETAIFRALINRHRDAARGVKHVSRFYRHQGKLHFDASRESIEHAMAEVVVGYVHVMNKNQFSLYRGSEYRSDQEVAPDYVIEVHGTDLPDDIGEIALEDLRATMKDKLEG